jgi:hypothetical protein
MRPGLARVSFYGLPVTVPLIDKSAFPPRAPGLYSIDFVIVPVERRTALEFKFDRPSHIARSILPVGPLGHTSLPP